MKWQDDTSISLRHDLPPTLAASVDIQYGDLESLVAELACQMNRAWQEGRRLSAHELLSAYPELRRQREAVLRLVCEEYCLRRENGLTISPDAWRRHFSEWHEELDALFACQRLIEPEFEAAPSKLLGKLYDFELLSELGQGGQGRVYLASQPQLADRPVVVKVTPCRGREHLTLARLQHTHIVPLLSAQDFADDNQRILCMPYFGNVTLAHLLVKLQPIPLAERKGSHILEALDETPAPVPSMTTSRGPARQLLSRVDYTQAIVWMGACLADALQYAHERNLLHLDLKPSNVLWTSDGQPMLLDFHLARAPIEANGARPNGLGGTPMWMAPELEEDLNAVFQRLPVPRSVDARADVFALGLVLYHALGGPCPSKSNPPPRLESVNPQVSPGLADIVHRCLAPDPADRYPNAEALGVDLRRHLNDLPLRSVSNRSMRERWQKWRRRKPHAFVAWLLAASLATVLGVVGAWSQWQQRDYDRREQEQQRAASGRIQQAEKALLQAKQFLGENRYELALVTLENGKALLPSASAPALHGAFEQQQQLARRQHACQALHDGVNALRAIVVADGLSELQITQLEKKCSELWDKRAWIISTKEPADERTRQDMIDLTVIWSDLALRATTDHDNAMRRRLVAALDEVERQCGQSALLDYARWQHRRALGEEAAANSRVVALDAGSRLAAWEHVSRARQLLQQIDPAVTAAHAIARPIGAADALSAACLAGTASTAFSISLANWHAQQASDLAPDQYWAHYYQGVAAFRLQQYADAALAFRVCIALKPGQAAAYHNRAMAKAAAGDPVQALIDYSKALEVDPGFAPSALNRSLVRVELRDYDAAVADLHLARRLGADDRAVQANLDIISRLRKSRPIR